MFTFDRESLLGLAGAIAISLGVAGSASAAVPGVIPGGTATNEALVPLFGNNNPRNGFYEATLFLVGGPSDILVEYLGSEAGYNNNFIFGSFNQNTGGGTNTFNAGGITSTTLLGVASGVLNFSFTSGGGEGTVMNVDPNTNAGTNPNFFVSFANEFASSGQLVYLFFDDGGAGPDDDHDDMVIRLSITDGGFEIPLPAAAWLMIAGIGGLGAVARRRKAAKAA
jgi:hypothetical protein